ncbi:MAG: GNAT family N-acetyltransferase [Deltaproteobacteria bacterium]
MKQLVYRHEFEKAFQVPKRLDVDFEFLSSPLDAIRLWRPLMDCLGFLGLIKTGLKLATKKRRLYCIMSKGCIAHYGWVSFSFCRYYTVQPGDVVIGPILTDDRFRGMGFATVALMQTINQLILERCRVLWIDTAEDNISCQKVIEKCGFGQSVLSFEK